MFKHFAVALPVLVVILPIASCTPEQPKPWKGIFEEVSDTLEQDVARLTPTSPRLGGSLLIAMPKRDKIYADLMERSSPPRAGDADFTAHSSEIIETAHAKAIMQVKLFDSVTPIYSEIPKQESGEHFSYKLWASIGTGTQLQWHLSRTGGGSQDILPLPQGTLTEQLVVFNAMIINAATDLGAAIPRQSLPGVPPTRATGFFINTNGDMLTSAGAVDACRSIEVTVAAHDRRPAELVAKDNDDGLAVVRVPDRGSPTAIFRTGAPIGQGEQIAVYGYPPTSVLSSHGTLTAGIVNSLAGPNDDSRQFQISAPLQPGDSGGPIFDTSGNVVGIVMGALSTPEMARTKDDIAQNVNFGIKAELAANFLTANGVHYAGAASKGTMHTEDIGDRARSFTNSVQCLR